MEHFSSMVSIKILSNQEKLEETFSKMTDEDINKILNEKTIDTFIYK